MNLLGLYRYYGASIKHQCISNILNTPRKIEYCTIIEYILLCNQYTSYIICKRNEKERLPNAAKIKR